MYQQYHHHDNGDNAAAGAGAGAEYAAALPTAASVDSANVVVVGAGVQHQNIQNHGHDQECWQSTSSTGVGSGGGNNDNSAAALMLAAAAAARECSAGVGSISMSVQEAVAAAADAEVDPRKQSRVERKRTREKKRRFDTNSQFTALAELVKEIEATDLAEEALFDFNKRHDNHGQEGEEEQQHQHQNLVDERVGPNNSNDGHDASVTVSSVASGEKHSKKFRLLCFPCQMVQSHPRYCHRHHRQHPTVLISLHGPLSNSITSECCVDDGTMSYENVNARIVNCGRNARDCIGSWRSTRPWGKWRVVDTIGRSCRKR
jgi:hypothetical protein